MEINSQRKKGLTRREFLALAWAASLAALLGQAGFALLQYFKPRAKPKEFGGRVIAGQITEFQPGTVRHVQKGRFYISTLEDGGMLALWHRCTHLGCTVPWREGEGQFNCPCHSSIFNTKGEVLSGPAPRPLDLFPIKVAGEQIVVATGDPIQRDNFNPSQATYS